MERAESADRRMTRRGRVREGPEQDRRESEQLITAESGEVGSRRVRDRGVQGTEIADRPAPQCRTIQTGTQPIDGIERSPLRTERTDIRVIETQFQHGAMRHASSSLWMLVEFARNVVGRTPSDDRAKTRLVESNPPDKSDVTASRPSMSSDRVESRAPRSDAAVVLRSWSALGAVHQIDVRGGLPGVIVSRSPGRTA